MNGDFWKWCEKQRSWPVYRWWKCLIFWVVIWYWGCLDASLYKNIGPWNEESDGCVDGLATWCLSLWPSGMYCCAEGGDSRCLCTRLHGVTSRKTVIWLPQSYASLWFCLVSPFAALKQWKDMRHCKFFPELFVTCTLHILVINTQTNALNKIQFMPNINLLPASVPVCHPQGFFQIKRTL